MPEETCPHCGQPIKQPNKSARWGVEDKATPDGIESK